MIKKPQTLTQLTIESKAIIDLATKVRNLIEDEVEDMIISSVEYPTHSDDDTQMDFYLEWSMKLDQMVALVLKDMIG